MGFTSVHDRFMNDPKENFKFRCNMLANGWTEETVREIDAIAEAPGQPVPKAGQGRTWHQRTQYEGWYDRVDGHGAETATPIDQRNVPEYVHVRNAQRRAETAIAKGQLPEPGKGRSGYQEAKGKGPGKGKGQKRSWDYANRTAGPEWAAGAAWWATTAGTWTEGDAKQMGATDDSWSWLIPVLFIFMVGAIFGGVVGYLIGYIKHRERVVYISRPPQPRSLQQPTVPEPSAPRNRTPQWRAPERILITKTG